MDESKGFYNERSGLIIMIVGLVIFVAFVALPLWLPGQLFSSTPRRLAI